MMYYLTHIFDTEYIRLLLLTGLGYFYPFVVRYDTSFFFFRSRLSSRPFFSRQTQINNISIGFVAITVRKTNQRKYLPRRIDRFRRRAYTTSTFFAVRN